MWLAGAVVGSLIGLGSVVILIKFPLLFLLTLSFTAFIYLNFVRLPSKT